MNGKISQKGRDMSELHDEIQNLSAVLESLQTGVHVSQRPVLRLVSDHLRLLAHLLDKREILAPVAVLPGTGQGGAPAFACSAPEVAHVRQ